MKKAATKSTTTPAKPAPVPAKKKTASPAAKKPKAPTRAKVVKPAEAPAVKASAPSAVVTTIQALIDIGFGNALYIRGEGPGLSWEEGVAMDCVADDKWSFKVGETSKPIVVKFLVNDLSWSTGDDYVVQPGTDAAFTPTF